MTKRMIFFVLLSMILLSMGVSALGITPGRRTFDFASGATHTVEFSVVAPEDQDMVLAIYAQGDLKDYIALPQELLQMQAHEQDRALTYTLTLPDELSPGLHEAEIVVVQLPDQFLDTGEASVGAVVGVATQVHVRVPYPGKYAEASMNIIGSGDEEITFVLPVVNRGELDLTSVQAIIDIYGSLNTKVTTVTTNELAISGLGRKEIVAKWLPDVPAGRYRAVATVIADEQVITLESDFTAGQKALEIVQVAVNDFRLGEIAKFELLVENNWSEPIQDAVAQMQISRQGGGVIADFTSASYDVPALSKALMVAFWDTSGVAEGTYPASVLLHYAQQTAREDFDLAVASDSIRAVGLGYVIAPDSGGTGSMTVLLVTVIGVLVLINILWFFVLRKRLKG